MQFALTSLLNNITVSINVKSLLKGYMKNIEFSSALS